ncbi:hypothetical protein CC86DRAFT_383506 [Ophiobolus disseminans]|uniref:Uncharacterized protein n=1 Tax=Ophiobolus disseminans TaxID=1469910 RepID=A0A6A6ZUH3_9PLEO|nr:hypothetical protein CC86DRAFT_383506 [Ophiobolus disseminans]
MWKSRRSSTHSVKVLRHFVVSHSTNYDTLFQFARPIVNMHMLFIHELPRLSAILPSYYNFTTPPERKNLSAPAASSHTRQLLLEALFFGSYEHPYHSTPLHSIHVQVTMGTARSTVPTYHLWEGPRDGPPVVYPMSQKQYRAGNRETEATSIKHKLKKTVGVVLEEISLPKKRISVDMEKK